jgi:cleavage stimulation factor subunit 3
MAYTWTSSVGKQEEAISILKAGLEANPSRYVADFLIQFTFLISISFLLTFAYAEALEVKKEFEEVHALYEKFLGTLRANLEQLEGASGNTSLASNGSSQITNGNANADGGSQNSSFNTQSGEEPQKKTELQKLRTEYGLAWIMYMRFGMRAEGVKPSRTIFAKARKDRWTPWEVYEAAGMSLFLCVDLVFL